MSYDYGMEIKLAGEAPELHRIFSDNVVCCQNMLNMYKSIFPNFTDHTVLHSLEVISFCNELIGENLPLLNTDEIFILLMAAYLHDSGMGISEKDYKLFLSRLPEAAAYVAEHPEKDDVEVIRRFHNDFSGRYIEKYASFFDFPSEGHLFAVIQVSRGHRKTDLFDEAEYPAELKLPNGNTVHLPYLAALIRMADEIDIAADRNIQFLYDISALENERDIMEFGKHQAIRHIDFEPDKLTISADMSDEKIRDGLNELFAKLTETLDYCVRVVNERTPFTVKQTKIAVRPIEKTEDFI